MLDSSKSNDVSAQVLCTLCLLQFHSFEFWVIIQLHQKYSSDQYTQMHISVVIHSRDVSKFFINLVKYYGFCSTWRWLYVYRAPPVRYGMCPGQAPPTSWCERTNRCTPQPWLTHSLANETANSDGWKMDLKKKNQMKSELIMQQHYSATFV